MVGKDPCSWQRWRCILAGSHQYCEQSLWKLIQSINLPRSDNRASTELWWNHRSPLTCKERKRTASPNDTITTYDGVSQWSSTLELLRPWISLPQQFLIEIHIYIYLRLFRIFLYNYIFLSLFSSGVWSFLRLLIQTYYLKSLNVHCFPCRRVFATSHPFLSLP